MRHRHELDSWVSDHLGLVLVPLAENLARPPALPHLGAGAGQVPLEGRHEDLEVAAAALDLEAVGRVLPRHIDQGEPEGRLQRGEAHAHGLPPARYPVVRRAALRHHGCRRLVREVSQLDRTALHAEHELDHADSPRDYREAGRHPRGLGGDPRGSQAGQRGAPRGGRRGRGSGHEAGRVCTHLGTQEWLLSDRLAARRRPRAHLRLRRERPLRHRAAQLARARNPAQGLQDIVLLHADILRPRRLHLQHGVAALQTALDSCRG
mmetsp:Transcript_50541/g.163643  ORF Transcript_50541/g.163643 Transcript_50541/m.163643 type:complete len:264 (+) Transcript_50541:801-1592(+)